jgi:WD40 repeat protein
MIGGVCLLAVAIVVAAVILAHSLGAKSPQAAAGTTPGIGSSGTPGGQGRSSGTGGSSAQVSNSPASGSQGGTSGQVSATTGYQLAHTLSTGSSQGLTSVTWNAGSTLVATSSKDGSTYVWNVATGQMDGQPLTVPGAGKAFAAAISADGTEVAAGYSTATTYLFKVATGRVVATMADPGGSEVDSVAFSPDGHTLATTDTNGNTYLWHIGSGGGRLTPAAALADPYHQGVWSAVFSSNGTLATGDYSDHVVLWDVASDSRIGALSLPGSAAVSALAFSTDGSVLAAGDKAGDALLWNVVSGRHNLFEVTPGYAIWGASFSRSDVLAMADDNGHTYLWHVGAGGVVPTSESALLDPSHGTDGVGSLGFSGDGMWLVTGDTNGSAYAWKVG